MTRNGLAVAFRVSYRDLPGSARTEAAEADRLVHRIDLPAHKAILCERVAR
jgi:hypothetical protein